MRTGEKRLTNYLCRFVLFGGSKNKQKICLQQKSFDDVLLNHLLRFRPHRTILGLRVLGRTEGVDPAVVQGLRLWRQRGNARYEPSNQVRLSLCRKNSCTRAPLDKVSPDSTSPSSPQRLRLQKQAVLPRRRRRWGELLPHRMPHLLKVCQIDPIPCNMC